MRIDFQTYSTALQSACGNEYRFPLSTMFQARTAFVDIVMLTCTILTGWTRFVHSELILIKLVFGFREGGAVGTIEIIR